MALIAIVVGGMVLASCAGDVTESATSSSTSSAAPMPDRDLSVIVLDADAAPEGTKQDETGETRAAVVDRVVVSGRESQFLELPGWRNARYSQYSGEGGLFLSLGVQFDTVENAEGAFDLFLDELESEDGYGLDSSKSEQIGDEGKCTEGANRDVGGVHEKICLWRTGPLILVAGGTLAWADLYDLATAWTHGLGENGALGGGSRSMLGMREVRKCTRSLTGNCSVLKGWRRIRECCAARRCSG